jgi:periplasmic protein TonB
MNSAGLFFLKILETKNARFPPRRTSFSLDKLLTLDIRRTASPRGESMAQTERENFSEKQSTGLNRAGWRAIYFEPFGSRRLTLIAENLREFFRPNPPTRGPVTLDCRFASPIESVKSAQFTRVQSLSVTMHVLLLTLLIAPAFPKLLDPVTSSQIPWKNLQSVAIFHPPSWMNHEGNLTGGRGGERNPLSATRGMAPPYANIQLVPPRVKPPENVETPIPPTLIGDPRISPPRLDLNNWGDPSSQYNNNSTGPGSRGGIGPGDQYGIGNGTGDSVGSGDKFGLGDRSGCPGCGGNSMPACIYCPRADYTDEAVKAKHQGSVYLLVVVGANGRATNIQIAKGLGMGLDEKAVEKVRTWRFKPAVGPDGKPIAMQVSIEVLFHLY